MCGGGGGKLWVKHMCMYAALFRLSLGIVAQTARRRESVPNGGHRLHDDGFERTPLFFNTMIPFSAHYYGLG